MPVRCAISQISAIRGAGKTAPVGLQGELMTMALVRGVRRLEISVASGMKPRRAGSEKRTGTAPAR